MADKASPIRRIVTGHDSNGSAKVIIDGDAQNVRTGSSPGQYTTLMWCTDSMPGAMPLGEDAEDMGARKLGTYPPVNGTRFMIAEYPPDNIPRMHRTETIDYIIVLDGEIDMELDEGRVVVDEEGRRDDPARHQPCMDQSRQGNLPHGVRADRRRTAWDRPRSAARRCGGSGGAL